MAAIITWINAAQKAAGMAALATKVGTVHSRLWADNVNDAGETSIQQSVVDGGINKTAKGGSRIRTGSMFDSIDTKIQGGAGLLTLHAGFGVTSGAPKYTIYQERGTRGRRVDSPNPRLQETKGRGGRGGVPAMLAIPEAKQAMEVEAWNAGSRMLGHIKLDWDAL